MKVKNRIVGFVYIIIATLISCNSNDVIKDYRIKYDKCDDSLFCEKIDYIDKNLTDTIKYYWGNRKLKIISEYRNGLENKVDGWVSFYDSINGKCTDKDFYINGKNNLSYNYYANGNIELIAEKKDGKQVGSTLIYDSLGNLKEYVLFDFNQLKAFKKIYKNDGCKRIEFKQDYLISQYYFSDEQGKYIDESKMSFNIDSNYIYNVLVAKPPDNKRYIEMSILNSNQDSIISSLIKDTTAVIKYNFSFEKKDTYKFCIKCELIDDFKDSSLIDSMCYLLNVSEPPKVSLP